jgi:hypothetical protein
MVDEDAARHLHAVGLQQRTSDVHLFAKVVPFEQMPKTSAGGWPPVSVSGSDRSQRIPGTAEYRRRRLCGLHRPDCTSLSPKYMRGSMRSSPNRRWLWPASASAALPRHTIATTAAPPTVSMRPFSPKIGLRHWSRASETRYLIPMAFSSFSSFSSHSPCQRCNLWPYDRDVVHLHIDLLNVSWRKS